MQKWLDNNNFLMYPTHYEDKSVFAEKFIRKLKGKIYKNWQQIIVNLTFVI